VSISSASYAEYANKIKNEWVLRLKEALVNEQEILEAKKILDELLDDMDEFNFTEQIKRNGV